MVSSELKWEVRRWRLKMEGLTAPVIEKILADEQLAEYRRSCAVAESAPDVAVPGGPEATDDAPQPLTTAQMAEAFDGIDEQTAKQWREKLGDTKNHQWVQRALCMRGKAPSPSTWWPLKFAEALQDRGVTFETLNRAFLAAPPLKPWIRGWQEAHRERNAFGS